MNQIPPIPTYEAREIYNPKLGKQVTHGRPFTVALYSEHLERIAKLTAEVEAWEIRAIAAQDKNTHLQALLDSQNASNERLDAECHRLRGEVERLTREIDVPVEAEIEALEAENTRLKAPVSLMERRAHFHVDRFGFVLTTIDGVNALIASRAAIKEGQ